MSVNVLYKTQTKATGGRDGHAATLDETIENQVAISLAKEHFIIRRTRADGTAMLHFYAVRAQSPKWVSIGGETRRVSKRYAEHLFDLKPETLDA